MPSPLTIALTQFDIAWEDQNANIQRLESMLQFEQDVDIVVLPEMWSTGFSMRPEAVAEKHPGAALSWMIATSQKLNTCIAGSISVADSGRYYNRFYFVHTDGTVDHYDKKHLFSFGKEDLHYTPGQSRIVTHVKGWKIMPIICYDLRFPVWCRNNLDYDLILLVANWPATRIHHWDTLIRARAIENQSFVAAVNRIGTDGNNLHYPGHSSIIDMNGMSVAEMDNNEGVGIFTLEKDELISYRNHFRFLQDRDAFEF